MAVKAADQVSIIDVTDAYSVILTSEAYTFVGTTRAAKPGSCTTQVVCMQGVNEVGFKIGSITCPSGISASVGNDGKTITITASSSMTAAGDVSIPITINGTGVTITKKFSCGLALTGATGDPGADAITMAITTDHGTVFKNSNGSTTLTAHVYKAGAELSSQQIAQLGTIKWYKDGGATSVGSGSTLSVSASSVNSKAVYTAQLEG